jgi:CxxC motif-containing protein
MKKEMICIGCPMGCYLTVDYDGKTIRSVSGNRCKVGLEYAEKEISNPERTLTTTVKVKNGHLPLVSVRTNKPIPKNKIFDIMDLLAKIEVEAPVKIGDPIVQNILGTGVNVVATKNIIKKEAEVKVGSR